MSEREIVCFTCGHPVANALHANRLEDGEPCSTCRDRILDAVPSLLPGFEREAPAELEEARLGPRSTNRAPRLMKQRGREEMNLGYRGGPDDPIGA